MTPMAGTTPRGPTLLTTLRADSAILVTGKAWVKLGHLGK